MVQDTGEKASVGPLRPIALPKGIEVKADGNQRPVAVQLGGRWLQSQVRDCWRIDDEWWGERPVSRMYFDVLLANGLRCTLFLDLLADQWYRQQQA
ncbi:MAG: hypothetical protein ABIH46_10730 [Chloroflexota bacterium]